MRYKPQKLLQELLLQAYDYVVENYDDVIDQLTSTIEEQLSDTAIEEAEAVKEEFVAEFNCVSEVGLLFTSQNFKVHSDWWAV